MFYHKFNAISIALIAGHVSLSCNVEIFFNRFLDRIYITKFNPTHKDLISIVLREVNC